MPRNNNTDIAIAIDIDAAQCNWAKSDQHLEGREEFQRQVQASLDAISAWERTPALPPRKRIRVNA